MLLGCDSWLPIACQPNQCGEQIKWCNMLVVSGNFTLFPWNLAFFKSQRWPVSLCTLHWWFGCISQSIEWLKGYSLRPHDVVKPFQVGFCRWVSWVEFPCCQVVTLSLPQLANQMKHGAQIHVSRGVLQEEKAKPKKWLICWINANIPSNPCRLLNIHTTQNVYADPPTSPYPLIF